MEWSRCPREDRCASGRVCQGQDRVGGTARSVRWSLDSLKGPKKKVIAVCGPTASGKSGLADRISCSLTRTYGEWTPVLIVDSMQVYRELPMITNQARNRPVQLAGIASVAEEWTVARHRKLAREIIQASRGPVVLDAGTGMYLNAILMDIPLAPKVPREVREKAASLSESAANPRREARRLELSLAGAPERGSIWNGDLLYDTTILYLRPTRDDLDANIARRSERIARDGVPEARRLTQLVEEGLQPNASVMDSIGVRELLDHLEGRISLHEAEERIAVRTRRLARRQMRWFDKLARTLSDRARVLTAETTEAPYLLHCIHDTMEP